MILKKFFGKTIEMAKKSARQMYGDDIVILESFHSDGHNDAGVTVLVDTPSSRKKPTARHESEETGFRNVFYKRSDVASGSSRFGNNKATAEANGATSNGSRKFNYTGSGSLETAEMENGSGIPVSGSPSVDTGIRQCSRFAGDQSPPKISNNLKTLRKLVLEEENGKGNGRKFGNNSGGSISGYNSELNGGAAKNKTQKQRFQPSNTTDLAPGDRNIPAGDNRREVIALHKRFDKLEALLDSALISSNLDYASHPAFQQLVQTGIKPTVIARWFRDIIERGTDPNEEPQQFMSELSAIIRNALKSNQTTGEPGRYMLFTGPSGSGKTQLIMKLLLHPEFFLNKKTAVVSLQPESKKKQPWYSILQPFCEDHNIPCYILENRSDVTRFHQEWEQFDHVLIDSPAIPVEQESSFRQYWKMRQKLASLTPLEVHYVVNASLNRYYFRNSGKSHHPLQPDYVAITHLDEVSEWGPVIPFLEEMGCGARYISLGNSIPDGLAEFNPVWFAQQVLQDT